MGTHTPDPEAMHTCYTFAACKQQHFIAGDAFFQTLCMIASNLSSQSVPQHLSLWPSAVVQKQHTQISDQIVTATLHGLRQWVCTGRLQLSNTAVLMINDADVMLQVCLHQQHPLSVPMPPNCSCLGMSKAYANRSGTVRNRVRTASKIRSTV